MSDQEKSLREQILSFEFSKYLDDDDVAALVALILSRELSVEKRGWAKGYHRGHERGYVAGLNVGGAVTITAIEDGLDGRAALKTFLDELTSNTPEDGDV